MERLVNSLMRDCRGAERPCREWCAGLGTVVEALEGLGSCGFDADTGFDVDTGVVWGGAGAVEYFLPCALKYEGGKCLAL
jgi:hypothetical protein